MEVGYLCGLAPGSGPYIRHPATWSLSALDWFGLDQLFQDHVSLIRKRRDKTGQRGGQQGEGGEGEGGS